MESKPKPGVGIPRPEMPTIGPEEEKPRRTNRGLVIALVVLAIAVGLGVALSVMIRDEAERPPAFAGWVIDEYAAAVNRSDGGAVAALFADDGFIRLSDGTVHEGRSAIQGFVDSSPPMHLARIGELTGDETHATATFTYASDDGSGTLTKDFVFVGNDLASVTDSE